MSVQICIQQKLVQIVWVPLTVRRSKYNIVYSLSGYDRRGRCPRGVWRTPPPERCPACAPVVAGPAPGSRPAAALRPRPRHRNAPMSQHQRYNHTKHYVNDLLRGQRQIQRT